MVLYTSKAAFLLEKSMLYRWLRFLLIPLGLLLWSLFLKSDIELNLAAKIIVLHVVTLAIFYIFTRLSDWLSRPFKKNIQIACFDHGKLSFNLDVQVEYDATKIQRIEFDVPSVFRAWNWPYTKNTIILFCSDGVKELKTSFELMALQSFLCEINCFLNQNHPSSMNKVKNA